MVPVRVVRFLFPILRNDGYAVASSAAVVRIDVLLIRTRLRVGGVAALVCTVASKLIEEAVEFA
jgi:hypothetical protein